MGRPLRYSQELAIEETPIHGLLLLTLPVHGDNRGWFKENWQREKMTMLGLPDFGPVQNNISFNAKRGVTRGIHAEPWDKYISIGMGRIFGAWVDLREGESFGRTFTAELGPTRAVIVPRGVGNGFQTLEDNTVYTYLVNDHWSAENTYYAFLNLADTTVNIEWPISLEHAELSDKDRSHPLIHEVTPVQPRKILITGANGQLGKALQKEFPDAEFASHQTLDITKPESWHSRNWRQYRAIINAAAYTNVDEAETSEGRKKAWSINAHAPAYMAKIANEHGLTLVHVSTDYVFDGTVKEHGEDEIPSPLGVYGQSKAAGDAAVATTPRHYVVRTSWVTGDGNNFVKTMHRLAKSGISPAVVNDQIGRPTFTGDLAKAIRHLIETTAPYGVYNVTNNGPSVSWHEVARKVFEFSGEDPARIRAISTADYFKDKPAAAPRPLQSTLKNDKISAAGLVLPEWELILRDYVHRLGKDKS